MTADEATELADRQRAVGASHLCGNFCQSREAV